MQFAFGLDNTQSSLQVGKELKNRQSIFLTHSKRNYKKCSEWLCVVGRTSGLQHHVALNSAMVAVSCVSSVPRITVTGTLMPKFLTLCAQNEEPCDEIRKGIYDV